MAQELVAQQPLQNTATFVYRGEQISPDRRVEIAQYVPTVIESAVEALANHWGLVLSECYLCGPDLRGSGSKWHLQRRAKLENRDPAGSSIDYYRYPSAAISDSVNRQVLAEEGLAVLLQDSIPDEHASVHMGDKYVDLNSRIPSMMIELPATGLFRSDHSTEPMDISLNVSHYQPGITVSLANAKYLMHVAAALQQTHLDVRGGSVDLHYNIRKLSFQINAPTPQLGQHLAEFLKVYFSLKKKFDF
ncbi:hypothetical protein J4464_01275 [Candidatus Woesearchaeota archaeon]|nr:hypothetical protein [Candidatus Woesearchaeota archaeon]